MLSEEQNSIVFAKRPYYLNGILVNTVISHSNLGILSDNQLKFHGHTTQVTTKANRVLGMIKYLLNISAPPC